MLPLLLVLLLAPETSAGERSALERDPKGWVDILPGPGPKLAGWSRVAPISTRGVHAQVNADLEIWMPDRKTGVLECLANLPGERGSHEMLRHDKEVGDFIFHVEWRFVDPARPGWNAGIYARVRKDAKVWHQAQVGGEDAGYWFGDTLNGAGNIVRLRTDAKEKRVKPPGEWNTYEITGRGDTLSLWVNGATVAEFTGLHILRGHVGLEAERHHIQFRNLKLKELRAVKRPRGSGPLPGQ